MMDYKDHLDHSYSAFTLLICHLHEAQCLAEDPDDQRILDGCLPALSHLRSALDRLVGHAESEWHDHRG